MGATPTARSAWECWPRLPDRGLRSARILLLPLRLPPARSKPKTSPKRASRLRFYVYDTKLDPTLALEAIKELDRRGVSVIIGPQSSAEVAMIKPYADRRHILVISQGSTASSLAIPGDNIFRFCPDEVAKPRLSPP